MSLNGFGVFTVSVALAADADRDNSLDGINTIHLDTGVLGWVQSGAAASRLYWLDKSDTTTVPDGVNVIAPLTGPGRWKLLIGAPGAATIKVGFDQNTKTQALSDAGALIPRDGGTPPAPLKVVLTGLTPGNFIEIDWDMGVQTNDGVDQEFGVTAIVNFDAVPTDPTVDPTGWFAVVSASDLRFLRGVTANPWPDLMRSLSAFEIPPAVSQITVNLLYVVDSPAVLVFGNDEVDFSPAPATLKVSELTQPSVQQPPPIFLIPL